MLNDAPGKRCGGSVLRMLEITDTLLILLLEMVHRLELKAERKADKGLLEDLKRVPGKNNGVSVRPAPVVQMDITAP